MLFVWRDLAPQEESHAAHESVAARSPKPIGGSIGLIGDGALKKATGRKQSCGLSSRFIFLERGRHPDRLEGNGDVLVISSD